MPCEVMIIIIFGASALLFALKPLLPGFTLMMNDSFMAAHRSWEQ